MKEALALVRKFYSDDDDENPEKMLQKEFNTKAEVLMKGTNSLRVTFIFIFPQKNTRICIITIYSIYFSIHEKSTLSVKKFKVRVASRMVRHSAGRDHTLTNEQALTALDAVDFVHAKTCAKCDHRV